MQVFFPVPLLGLAAAQQGLNLDLFDYGQKEPLLGSYFGVPGANATFDYVVVGGGTAGLTIASRLAQNRSASVAVIEAGGFYEVDNGNLSIVPAYCPTLTGSDPRDTQPLIDWGSVSQPQPSAGNRILGLPHGKTLGGGSARNYMVYQRPTVGSLQKWADDVGDQSYTFANMLPYYKKSCHYTPPNQELYFNSTNSQAEDAFSPSGGPLEVSFSNTVDPFGTWCQKAFAAVGMETIDGLNSGKLLGAAFSTSTINPRNAHRSSSESSFLQEALNSGSGPIVYKNTLAQKILFDSDKVATGVQVSTAGTYGTGSVNFTLSARKEVIVSAGAFKSPQLLMVSGVGPCTELSKFNISCISDLPGVGQNMQDHPFFGSTHRVNVLTASAGANNQTLAALFVEQYLQNATGPLSWFGGAVYGWEKLPEPYRSNLSSRSIDALSAIPNDWPEIEWLPATAFLGNNSNWVTADPLDGYNYATINNALVASMSRGTISLAQADMNTPPLIDPQWLVDPTDMELAIQAFKRQREVWEVFVKLGVADPEEYYPGAHVATDEQIREYIEETVVNVHHSSCTCKMGREDDKMAVLDSAARVYGVHGLRVVDASSFPLLPPGHPQSVVYALAEKIADEILNGN